MVTHMRQRPSLGLIPTQQNDPASRVPPFKRPQQISEIPYKPATCEIA